MLVLRMAESADVKQPTSCLGRRGRLREECEPPEDPRSFTASKRQNVHAQHLREALMANLTQFRDFTFIVGIDIDINVFQVFSCNCQTGEISNEQVSRNQLLEDFANVGKCLIGMEACGSSQYWVRKLIALGHEVRLIDAKLVKPFVFRNKSDKADAEGIFNALMQGVRTVAENYHLFGR